jgi:hypothetical protein
MSESESESESEPESVTKKPFNNKDSIESVEITINDSSNIPSDYNSYHIMITNNVYSLMLIDSTAIKFIKEIPVTITVNKKHKHVSFLIDFSKKDQSIFNKLLDHSDVSISEMTEALVVADSFFDNYDVSRITQNNIDKYIVTTYKSDRIWQGLTSKPDYNMCLFKKRVLPYFHLECKDWVKSSIDAISNSDIPSDDSISINNEHIPNHNNNYLEWGILSIKKYPDISLLAERIKIYYKLNMKKQALMLFMKLMLSPRNCHIIKCSDLWVMLLNSIKCSPDLNEIIKYCYHYAMYILRQEETIMFSNVKLEYRVLFSLDEAASLPTFNESHIERNPYILQLTYDTRLSDSIPFYLKGKREINKRDKFKKRFRLATGGAFEGIDMKKISATVTGSILIPCVHTSPLEKGFDSVDWVRERKSIKLKYPYMVDNPESTEEILFLNYLEYYYPSYCSLTDDEFMKQVIEEKKVEQEHKNPYINYENDDVLGNQQERVELSTVIERKYYANHINEKQINTELPELPTAFIILPTNKSKQNNIGSKINYNQLSDIDISITTKDFDIFKINVISLHKQVEANCKHRGPVYIKEVKTTTSYKFNLYGPGLPRPMDVFRVNCGPAKMVKRFHIHAVKMYYDNEVTMFRSCVASLLSGVGENYKWFSCNKLPIDVLFKYAQRGISIVMNKHERDSTSKYLSTNTRWGKMLKELKIKPKKIYCCVTEKHSFFYPDRYNTGIRQTLRQFNRNDGDQYNSSLVVDHSNSLFPYGELIVKDINKMYAPNPYLINACMDHFYKI